MVSMDAPPNAGSISMPDLPELPDLGPGPFPLPQRIGGALCLDFANTVDERLTNHPKDRLAHYAHFLAWAADAGALASDHADRLQEAAAADPMAAAATFTAARLLREVMFRVME